MSRRVIILGGGFGGLYAAKALAGKPDVQITLIDRRNFHLFQPLLYQVATGELSPSDVAFPLRAVLSSYDNVRVIMGEAVDIDVNERTLRLSDGASEPYDYLIVSTGARNFYFGNDQWAEFAPGLKTIEEATRIRHRVLYAFEAAERESNMDEHRAWLTFVVVGAGPTGVELAGALGEIANKTLKDDFRSVNPENACILLVDGGDRILGNFPPDLSEKAEKALIKLGVRTIFKARVTAVDENGVTMRTLAGEKRIHSHTVLWAAGVSAASFSKTLGERAGSEVDRTGRVLVNEYANIPGHPEIFVIGDAAHQKGKDGNPLPGVAPVAMQQGRYVGKSILKTVRDKKVEPFHYLDKGTLAVIGRASAVAQFGKIHVHGFIAWFTWLFVHLMYLVGFQNRIVVFIRWGFNYFTFNRGARLITGDPSPYEASHRAGTTQTEPPVSKPETTRA